MIQRLIKALIVAVAVGLVLTLLGIVLATLHVEISVTIGHFLTSWAWIIGVLVGLWYFFTEGVFLTK